MTGMLPVDQDELAACVSCGLCLAHCPTYRVTGEEALSPRGRIAAMRAVDSGTVTAAHRFEESMLTCVGCRACETACPSAVPFGRLMEGARQMLSVPRWQRVAYRALEHPRLLRALTTAGGLAQRARLVPTVVAQRMSMPRLPLRQQPLVATGTDAWLFTGCVMDAWQRPVHQATVDVLAAMGVGVMLPGDGAACCGAMTGHAGLHDDAVRIAHKVVAALPGDAPILVDSAGCGASLKEYAHLLDTPEARGFSGRVYDIHEWIAGRADRLPAPANSRLPNSAGERLPHSAGAEGLQPRSGGVEAGGRLRIAVQDPCHLRHVQRAEARVRTVLAPYGELVELTDEGRCCGAGGAYSVLQPALARQVRNQKVAIIGAAGADVVASANPGCSMWLAAGGVETLHPMQIVARAAGLAGYEPLPGRDRVPGSA